MSTQISPISDPITFLLPDLSSQIVKLLCINGIIECFLSMSGSFGY